jgi:drug/metabolite transporter (DMT)-like permease
MKLTRNKRSFYQQGIRAATLIMSSFQASLSPSQVEATLFQGFLAEGLARTDAGLGSVMIDSQPLAVAILCLWLFQEKIGFWGWLGLVIGVAGISLIGLPDGWILGLFHPENRQVSAGIEQLFQGGEWLML